MNRKPGPLLFFCLTFLFTIGFPSCDGPDYFALRDIERVEILDRANEIYLSAPASTSSDSIALIIFNKLVSFSINYPEGLMQSAWATSPPKPLMANEIIDIRIYCEQGIYGILPGENLATELNFGFFSSQGIPLADFIEELPNKGDQYYGGLEEIAIYFDSKPDPGTYQFTIEIEDNNGHIFSGNPLSLTWL
ncbi:MAG TPA: hypothetical protein VMZ69_03305 [Saprospiraceae bacterium]|nr:hypothetical protein [Saprospiraceae bacterium]